MSPNELNVVLEQDKEKQRATCNTAAPSTDASSRKRCGRAASLAPKATSSCTQQPRCSIKSRCRVTVHSWSGLSSIT